MKSIFELLRLQTGHDFSRYKMNTVTRRMERRVAFTRSGRWKSARYLEKTSADVEALFRDLLIGVTSFFRDPEAFEALRQQAVARLFEGRAAGSADPCLGTRLFRGGGGLIHEHPSTTSTSRITHENSWGGCMRRFAMKRETGFRSRWTSIRSKSV